MLYENDYKNSYDYDYDYDYGTARHGMAWHVVCCMYKTYQFSVWLPLILYIYIDRVL